MRKISRSSAKFIQRYNKKKAAKAKRDIKQLRKLKQKQRKLQKEIKLMQRVNYTVKKRRSRNLTKKYKKSKTYHKSRGLMGGAAASLVGAAVYGGVRARLSDALLPVTQKIPAGEISDEVGMMALSFLAKKALPGQLKAIPKAAMQIEAARIGEYLFNQGFSNLGAQKTQNSSVVLIG